MVLDVLAVALGAGPWRPEHQAEVARAQVGGETVLLAKPQTFMNNCGQAVRALAAYYRVAPADMLVISDDLDLPFGRIRLRPGGAPGGHNGLRSIIGTLGTPDFPRLRIGIGRPAIGEPIDWVLSPFSDNEARDLAHICQVAAAVVLQALNEGLIVAMNATNGRRDVREPLTAQVTPGGSQPGRQARDNAPVGTGVPAREEPPARPAARSRNGDDLDG